jgi:SAM-dependent methyltransferase
MRKVNLGCGLCCGQTWINVDGSWNAWFANYPFIARILSPIIGRGWKVWPKGIRHANIRTSALFESSSVDAIYASHLLEHLKREDCVVVLQRCRQLLKPGGVLRVVLPDLEGMTRRYLTEVDRGGMSSDAASPSPADQFFEALHCHTPHRAPRSILYRLYQCIFDYHTHFWMYDRRSMSLLLETAGFVSIAECQTWTSDIPAIQEVERQGASGPNGAGFILECRKPLAAPAQATRNPSVLTTDPYVRTL